MKKIHGFLLGVVVLFASCKKEEPIPEVSLDEFFVEFVVDGKEKVHISQQLNPQVQVYGYSSVKHNSLTAFKTLEYGVQMSSQESLLYMFFTHSTDKKIHQEGGNQYTDELLQYLRKKVLASPIKFAPVDDTAGLAIRLEFGDIRFPASHRSYGLGLVDGTISPISADQSNSSFKITNHRKIKLKQYEYSGYDVEQIEGTFDMKLYSRVDTVSATEGKFKLFMILN